MHPWRRHPRLYRLVQYLCDLVSLGFQGSYKMLQTALRTMQQIRSNKLRIFDFKLQYQTENPNLYSTVHCHAWVTALEIARHWMQGIIIWCCSCIPVPRVVPVCLLSSASLAHDDESCALCTKRINLPTRFYFQSSNHCIHFPITFHSDHFRRLPICL
jgi:hypothetical protein